jgi:hypothetical protein
MIQKNQPVFSMINVIFQGVTSEHILSLFGNLESYSGSIAELTNVTIIDCRLERFLKLGFETLSITNLKITNTIFTAKG